MRFILNGNGQSKADRLVVAILTQMVAQGFDSIPDKPIRIHTTGQGVPRNAYGAYRVGVDGSHNIYLRPRKRHPQGLAYTLAHEMRHAYQVEQGWLSTMGGYAWAWDGKELCDGSDEDPSERDANATARAWVNRVW